MYILSAGRYFIFFLFQCLLYIYNPFILTSSFSFCRAGSGDEGAVCHETAVGLSQHPSQTSPTPPPLHVNGGQDSTHPPPPPHPRLASN
jgi:hypothetical protein